MKADRATNDRAMLLKLASGSSVTEVSDLVASVHRLFGEACFTVSDLTQVGHPVVHASDAFGELTGYLPGEATGRNLGFLQRADSDQEANERLKEALDEGRPTTVTVRNYRKDGALFYNEQHHVPIHGPDGRPCHLVVLQRDVTAFEHAAGAEAARGALAGRMEGQGASYAYALLLDRDGRAQWAWSSPGCADVTGYQVAEMMGLEPGALVLDDDREAFAASLQSLSAQSERHHAYRLRTKGGRVLWVEDFAMVRWEGRETGTRGIYGVVRDVTANRQVTAELWRGAHFDALTGLPNRYLLEDRIQQALYQTRREGGAALLALVDLDDFRFLNETLGAERGDRVLQEMAGRLGRHLRRSDTLARLDADTFAVLLGRLPGPSAALPVLDKIRATVTDPFHDRGATLRLSASIGVEMFPEGAASAPELLEHARTALEDAKVHQRGTYRFYRQGFDAAMRERAALEKELRRALLEDQLVLHYQPRVVLQTGSITSVEALVRWAHPERGLLKPAAFVPLAEEARLGGDLFGWVLERACAQAKRWQQQRTSRRVAVNVSPQALEDEDFTRRVQGALTRYDLHPGLLEIEINEQTGAKALEAADPHLHELRSMGVHVALDDFGVANASLSLLRGMPLDGLKIDRSFVGRLGTRDVGEDVELIRAIIALGKSLRLTVTAEGIETRAQNSLLRTLSCDEGQGFLFSQAVPAEYVPAFA